MNKWKLFSGSFLLNKIKLCGLALNALHERTHAFLVLGFLSHILPLCCAGKHIVFRKTFYLPSLHIRHALPSASNVLTHFCHPNLIHFTAPQILLRAPALVLPSWESCPLWTHGTSVSLFLCHYSLSALHFSCCCLFVCINALAVFWVHINSHLTHLCLAH